MYCSCPMKLPSEFNSWFELEKSEKCSQKYLAQKKIIISDCDGVLTDSKSIYGKEGKLFKTYGAYDKEAMELLRCYGWKFYFVTDDKAGIEITSARVKDLKKKFSDDLVYGNIGRDERARLVKKHVEDGYLVLFIGDSLSDIAAMSASTYSGTTNNAPEIVKKYCHFISKKNGSEGGFADLLLEANERLKKEI